MNTIRAMFDDPTLAPEQVREIAGAVAREFSDVMEGGEFAHAALREVIQSAAEPDALRQQNRLASAHVFALLSLRDAVQEATAAMKERANA